MATSISKLAVIISGHTKPLEDAMKRAESKVGSFGSSIKKSIGHGFGASLGAAGLDKMESAMKKAVADMPELASAAERAEKSFGGLLLKATGVSLWLPPVAKGLEWISDTIDGITPEMKEHVRLIEAQKNREKELNETRIEGLVTLQKSLEAQLDAIDPMREQLRIAEQLKGENDPYLNLRIPLSYMANKDYDAFAPEKARRTQEMIKEHQEMIDNPAWEGQHDLAIADDAHDKFIEQMDAELERIEELKEAAEEWQKVYDETIEQTGKEEEDSDNWSKMYHETLADMEDKEKAVSSPMRLSGAATAGSEAAYSIIANAQANSMKPEMQKQTKELQKLNAGVEKVVEKTGFQLAVSRMQLT